MRCVATFLFFLISACGIAQSLDSSWVQLVRKGGCLLGTQYRPEASSNLSGDVSVLNKKECIHFLSNDEKILIPFLIGKLSDTSHTNIHTCPYLLATEGEMAVYLLQRKIHKYWYDLPGFKKYQKKKETGKFKDSRQARLRKILHNDRRREKLKRAFLNK